MLKWIGGCLVLVVVGVGAAMWWGYRKLDTFAANPSATATIDASPSRVFASLANADSMTEWKVEGLGIRSSRRGLLRVGDTIHAQTSRASDNRPQRSIWVVSAVTPNQLLVLEMRNDSGLVMASRRDSLVARGESTLVVSTFAAPGFDSLRTTRGDSGAESKMLGVATKLLIGGMRMQSNVELGRLKARIEGKPMPGDSMPRPPQ